MSAESIRRFLAARKVLIAAERSASNNPRPKRHPAGAVMPSTREPCFRNDSWLAVRVMLWVAVPAIALACVAGVLTNSGGRFDSGNNVPFSTICTSVAVASGVLGAALLLGAGLTVPSAIASDNAFQDFRRGDVLADWTIPLAELDAFAARELADTRRAIWRLLGFWFVPSMSLVLYGIILGDTGKTVLVRDLTIALLVFAVLAGVFVWAVRLSTIRELASLRRVPRILIGRDAVCCGDTFRLWNANMMVLESVNLIPGAPPVIEFRATVSRPFRVASEVISIASAVSGSGNRRAALMNRGWTLSVPVPAANLNEAKRIVIELTLARRR